jgi:hypothetical protein
MGDFDGLQPFWKVLNEAGLSVGLWAAFACREPVEINGYAASAMYTSKETPEDNRIRPRVMQYCKKDAFLARCFDGNPPPRLYPLTLEQQGYKYDVLLKNPELAEKAVYEYSFSEVLDNFEEELCYFFKAMKKANSERPVDVLWFFTPSTDLIAHFGMRGGNTNTLLLAYEILDGYIGKMEKEFQPENIVFISDHGQWNYGDLVKSSNQQVRREAFSSSENALWLKDGNLALYGRNGALIFTAHSPTGCFAVAGKDVRHCEIQDMRTLDIYPTLLELWGAKLPEGREGYVQDIFDRNCVNVEKMLMRESIQYKQIVLIQSHSVEITNAFINDLYYRTRFARITVVGESKYEEIFRGNPRVSNFLLMEKFDNNDFDEVYCGLYNEITKFMQCIRVK